MADRLGVQVLHRPRAQYSAGHLDTCLRVAAPQGVLAHSPADCANSYSGKVFNHHCHFSQHVHYWTQASLECRHNDRFRVQQLKKIMKKLFLFYVISTIFNLFISVWICQIDYCFFFRITRTWTILIWLVLIRVMPCCRLYKRDWCCPKVHKYKS